MPHPLRIIALVLALLISFLVVVLVLVSPTYPLVIFFVFHKL